MEARDRVVSTETFLAYENLRNRAHVGFLINLHEEIRIVCDVDFFEGGSDRSEEGFCLDAVRAIVFGVNSDRHKIMNNEELIMKN